MFDLKGIYCPIATPFIDDKIAYDKLDENLDFWISSKLEGIVVMGSNGEFVSLRESEKEELIRHCCKRIAGKKHPDGDRDVKRAQRRGSRVPQTGDFAIFYGNIYLLGNRRRENEARYLSARGGGAAGSARLHVGF